MLTLGRQPKSVKTPLGQYLQRECDDASSITEPDQYASCIYHLGGRAGACHGKRLKHFLGHCRAKGKTKLALYHFFCLGCKASQEPDGKFAEYTQTSPTTGMFKAYCPTCTRIMNKVVRRADLEAIRVKIEVTVQQANPKLACLLVPCSNDSSEKEAQTNDKTKFG